MACCSEARLGGMLGGKCGLLSCRMGTGADGFAPLREALAVSDVPITQILPSHAERAVLLSDCRSWIRAGGNVVFTAGVEAGAAPAMLPACLMSIMATPASAIRIWLQWPLWGHPCMCQCTAVLFDKFDWMQDFDPGQRANLSPGGAVYWPMTNNMQVDLWSLISFY